jgi:hypothetical protein
MQDITLFELPLRAFKYVRSRTCRVAMEKSQNVLKLIAEADRAVGLIRARTSKNA